MEKRRRTENWDTPANDKKGKKTNPNRSCDVRIKDEGEKETRKTETNRVLCVYVFGSIPKSSFSDSGKKNKI